MQCTIACVNNTQLLQMVELFSKNVYRLKFKIEGGGQN